MSRIGLEDTRPRQEERAASGPYKTLGEQMAAVIIAGTPGKMADPRLFETRAATGLNETVGSEGGFLVQQDFSTALLNEGMQEAIVAPKCRPFPIGRNSKGVKLPIAKRTNRATGSRIGSLRLYWGDEATELTASKPEFKCWSST